VDAVLTGRVSRLGDRIQVSTELVKAEDGSHLWGKRYNGELPDLLALQQEMAADVSQRLQPQLSGEQKQRLSKKPTESPEAYQLYVKGRFFYNRWSVDGRRQAVGYFHQAIAKDPGFAGAYAGLAEAYSLRGFFGDSNAEEMAQGMAAAREAIALDNSLAEAHAALGLALMIDLNWHDSEQELRQAIKLNPNCSICRADYAWFLVFHGPSTDAIPEAKQAQILDPLSFMTSYTGAEALYFNRDYDAAIQQLKTAIEMEPSNPGLMSALGDAYLMKQMCSEAFKAYARSEELSGQTQNASGLTKAFETGGCRGALRKQLEFYSDPTDQDYYPMSAATAAAFMGDKDKAFKLLEMAYKTRQGIVWLKAEPQLENIRSDPRYFEWLRRIGLGDDGSSFKE
jgi:tetratricopeptide (TPR) repeat protein